MDNRNEPNIGRVVLVLPFALVAGAEFALQLGVASAPVPGGNWMAEKLAAYAELRALFLAHGTISIAALVCALVAFILFGRWGLQFWHNTVVARLSGARLSADSTSGFVKKPFDLLPQLVNAPAGKYFVGLDAKRRPVYLSEWDLDTHGHVLGHTGSGKTRSVLEPLMLQDMLRGKGVLFMDAKGSAENVSMMKALAVVSKRASDVRIFSLAHPEWSQTYNPVYLGANGDPLATAERVFSVFEMEHEYYRGQSKLLFYNLVRLMANTGKAFNLRDIRLAVTDDEILHFVFEQSSDKAAKYEIDKQLQQLGKRRGETFTGLYNALAEYDHSLLNSYNPDIVIDDVMNQNGIVYFNLPANLYALLAPAIGKIVLQHVKSVGALRQIHRTTTNQTPFSVNIDELNRFAFDELVPSLAMLRDAHVQFRLSHQSLGDLEQVSPVFARQVRDNTRWKIFLFENDAEHLEQIARAYGTKTAFKKTVAYAVEGLLFTQYGREYKAKVSAEHCCLALAIGVGMKTLSIITKRYDLWWLAPQIIADIYRVPQPDPAN